MHFLYKALCLHTSVKSKIFTRILIPQKTFKDIITKLNIRDAGMIYVHQ